MTVNDNHLVSVLQRVIDPLIVMGMLLVCTALGGGKYTGYSLILMILAFFISSAVFQHLDPYNKWRGGRMAAFVRDMLVGWAVTALLLVGIGQVSGMEERYDHAVVLLWFVLTPLTLLTVQLLAHRLGAVADHGGDNASAVIVGANDVSVRFANSITRNRSLALRVAGYFDDRGDDRRPNGMSQPMLGRMSDLAAYVREHKTNMIIISQPISAQPRIRKLLDDLADTTASVYFLPDIYVFDLMQARFDTVGGMPVIGIRESPFTGSNSLVKRISDIVLALLIQIMLTPLMLVIALLIKATSPGPIIFRQRRYGLNGEEIIVYKFRSMTVMEDGGKVVQAKKGDQRVTRVGAFLRRSSLDELPQFINVLQGRMSIVGPRPHAVAHNEQYRKLIKGYMLRHKVKPGITGWAQVNGLRGETETLDKMEARIQYDLDYLRNWSLFLDFVIILRTVLVVLKRDAH
ncbi:undecaprenyl-phosphate glucose phosphotransferase [Duganella sp. FT109W]|uniref:Undecaprenyl-phosphate glucose phosphotransferase n=1 Tax=Duganella margarita TaxID=2692170 RepID=A0ABW9WLI7_9BURK|nr:undecaprenyl-phosphate glucose phosphotransferase [Duganella margarita]MYN42057.1 undecaprenyl-phosphate glucose phosphotransferase [Duganella margarita]